MIGLATCCSEDRIEKISSAKMKMNVVELRLEFSRDQWRDRPSFPGIPRAILSVFVIRTSFTQFIHL